MTTRRALIAHAALLPALLLSRPAVAAEPPLFARDGLAIGGTDPVAYFAEGQPVAGVAAHELEWQGALWRFVSAANRDAFAADPEDFAPRFGGYCAWAVSRGYLAPTVPEAWTVHQGRLYLNASLRIRRRWERDIPGNIARAEANWPAVLS